MNDDKKSRVLIEEQAGDPAKTNKKLPGLANTIEEIPEGDLEGVAGGMGCQGTCHDTHVSD